MSNKSERRYRKQKINTYVSLEEINRLREVQNKLGFKSIYEILQYLVHCFLRVVDPDNDTNDTPIETEIIDMFTDNAEWEKRTSTSYSHAGMTIKQKPDQRKIKTANDL